MPEGPVPRPEEPVPVPRVVLCPYCGEVSKDPTRCDACRGHFDPLSRQATQNSMGPWFIRDAASPHRPGCSFEVLRGLALRKKIGLNTVLRGPTTNQFWSPARRVPGLANLLGVCHNCGWKVGTDDEVCLSCGATFEFHADRQHLGLTEVRLLPGHADPEAIADAASPERTPVSAPVARTAAPRMVTPGPKSPEPAKPKSAAPGPRALHERDHGGSAVPRWVWAVAGLAVVGAGLAAMWIMDKLPGMPSPILSGAESPPADSPSDASLTTKGPAPAVQESSVGTAGADSGAPDAVQSVETASPPESGKGQEDRLAEARRLLGEGTEASLRRAAEVAGGEDGVAIRSAVERLLSQAPLRRLP